MAANNGGGRQNSNMNEYVELSVKAEEDLYLTGNENTIRRVTAGTNYSWWMLKTQRFSSLFRHYAKYHGLRKDDLEYYFVSILDNENTPESVQFQRGDTIMVRKRRTPGQEPSELASDDDTFYNGIKGSGSHEMNEYVDLLVKAEEDLYVTENENTILRVTAGTNYSCIMFKTQPFSSLFRHYPKYHQGLQKDDLEYYFVNILENEDTPNSVQLRRGDTIMVRKRRRPEPPEVGADDDAFYKCMKE